jgi:hypothetical protein
MAGMTLTVEDEPLIESPSADTIRAVVERMTPEGGPGFIILDGRGADYAQAAGGDGAFAVEWREHTGDAFRHWTAGLAGQPDTGEVAIPTNGHVVRVRSNEQLGAADVVTILGAFLAGLPRPAQYAWRDVSDLFA